MHKSMKRISFLGFCLLICISFLPVKGVGSFTITNYKIDIDVDKSGVLDVVETIQLQNCTELHFQKNIQQDYLYTSQDNKTETYAYKISNIEVNNGEVSTDNVGGVEKIDIQVVDPNALVTLKYQVRMRNFGEKDKTVFLYSLLAPSIQANIESLQASISFANTPSTSFDVYSVDANGNRKEALIAQVNDKTLQISSTRALEYGNGIMISGFLRQKFFTYSNPITLDLFFTIFSIILVMGSYFFMIAYPKMQKRKRQMLECYPLEDIEIGTLGYLLDGVCDERDLTCILIEWANQNYISIRDENQTITIVLVNELPPSAKSYEKHFFNLLFTDYTFTTIDQLKERNLKAKMQEVLSEITMEQVAKGKKPVYTTSSYQWQLLACLCVCIPLMLTMFACRYEATFLLTRSLLHAGIVGLLVYANCLPWVWIVKNQFHLVKNTLDVYRVLVMLINFVCGGLLYVYLSQNGTQIVYVAISFTLTILYACIMIFMEKRTALGRYQFERLQALRSFIRRARSEQLSNLLYDNPYYFEDMLPYAYIFDITDIWGKKFTSIPLQAPFWYFHPNASANSTIYWMSALEKSIHDIQIALTSSHATTPKQEKKIKKGKAKKKNDK